MPLTSRQVSQVIAWINDHFPKGLRCPLCAQNRWETGAIFTGLPFDEAGIAHMEGEMNPMVQLRCQVCRHVVLFEAVALGLVTPDGRVQIDTERPSA